MFEMISFCKKILITIFLVSTFIILVFGPTYTGSWFTSEAEGSYEAYID